MEVKLPEPMLKGEMSVEEALVRRKSRRCYRADPLTLREVAQLLWAGQGAVKGGRRTAPSAGATYPMELYLVVREMGVENLVPGIYRYNPEPHTLTLVERGDLSQHLYRAALEQGWVLEAPVNIVLTAYPPRTVTRYGNRGYRYIYMEAGHVSQNIYLQAEALDLATVAVGAFYDEDVRGLLRLPKGYMILYIHPVGRRCRGD